MPFMFVSWEKPLLSASAILLMNHRLIIQLGHFCLEILIFFGQLGHFLFQYHLTLFVLFDPCHKNIGIFLDFINFGTFYLEPFVLLNVGFSFFRNSSWFQRQRGDIWWPNIGYTGVFGSNRVLLVHLIKINTKYYDNKDGWISNTQRSQ